MLRMLSSNEKKKIKKEIEKKAGNYKFGYDIPGNEKESKKSSKKNE